MQAQIQYLTKLSRSQGLRPRGTNHEELLAIRVLVVALAQALVALVQALVDLYQAYPLQVGLKWVVRRQVV